jgi:hypothetical protein
MCALDGRGVAADPEVGTLTIVTPTIVVDKEDQTGLPSVANACV